MTGILKISMAAALLSLGLAACDSTVKIGDVQRDVAAFDGKEVRLQGTADRAMKIPLVDVKTYRLRDSSGEIQVWASGDLPKEGEEVVVRGKVESIAIVIGQGYGVALRESERRPAGWRWPWQ